LQLYTQQSDRIHPTQKPIALYRWLLENYANDGDRILDTHVGSASSLIAAHERCLDYVGFEIDPDYHAAACKRIDEAKRQIPLFKPPKPPKQIGLFG